MSIKISNRLSQVKPSPTLAMTARAAEMKAQGKKIISLSVGEPDFPPPEYIKEAAIKAIKDDFNKYTAVEGTPELKQAIIDKFASENKLIYTPKEIIVSAGAKQNIYNACQALLDKGDEVIIPAPYWVSYPDMVFLADAIPVIIPTDMNKQFKIHADELAAAITSKTKMFMINSPSNPSGMAYTRKELEALAEVLLNHPKIVIVTDDIYEHILWENKPFVNIVNVCPELKDRTIVVNGMSKAYCMTGWRLGYAAAPENITAACSIIQSQSTSNPCSITQKAGVAALRGGLDAVVKMVEAFKRRHDLLVSGLNKIEGFKCLPANGTFYAFPNVKEVLDSMEMKNDVQLAEYLLVNAGVATVPGSAFGLNGYLRLSYALDDESLNIALQSIDQALRAKVT